MISTITVIHAVTGEPVSTTSTPLPGQSLFHRDHSVLSSWGRPPWDPGIRKQYSSKCI